MKNSTKLFLIFFIVLFGFVLTETSSAANFPLRVIAEDSETIFLGWDLRNVSGYIFYLDGRRVSSTLDGTRTEVRFRKGTTYRVVAIPIPVDEGVYPSPPPPVGNVVQLSGTLSPSQAIQSLGNIRPVTARGPATITGTLQIPNDVTLDGISVQGNLGFGNRSVFSNGSANGFDVTNGADNWELKNSVIDGKSLDTQNVIWDAPGGNGSRGWKIVGNTIRNFTPVNAGDHSEALYIGGLSEDGLLEMNTFTNNGNTAHIFFTWFGSGASTANYPRNICVRNNVFNATWGAYFAIQFRDEIPNNANIKIAPSNVLTTTKANNGLTQAMSDSPQFNGVC